MNREEIINNIPTDIQSVVNEKIKKSGLYAPPRPQDVVQGVNLFTEWEKVKQQYGGISSVPFNYLGDFLDKWSGLVAYSRWVEAVADLEQSTAKEVKEVIKKQLYTLQEGPREMKDALVYVDPLYIEWSKKALESNALHISIKAIREGYEQRTNAISREITRRVGDNSDIRRGINRGNTA